MPDIPTKLKDPGAELDYGFNWDKDDDPWLETGDEISTSTWTVPAGITEEVNSHTTTTTTIWLSGGTAGEIYRLVNHIVTTENREDERSVDIIMTQR